MDVQIVAEENVWPSIFMSDIYAFNGRLTKENIC